MIRRLWSTVSEFFTWPDLDPPARPPRMADVFALPLIVSDPASDPMGRVLIFDREWREVAGPMTAPRADAFVRAVQALHLHEEAEMHVLAAQAQPTL